MSLHFTRLALFLLLVALATPLAARDGKLIGTYGLLSIDGSAGGGLVPWALIAGTGEAGEWGASLGCNHAEVEDFSLDGCMLALGFDNRYELSASRQHVDLAGVDRSAAQTIVGGKLRLAGDLVYGSWPQLSLAIQHHRLSGLVLGERERGTDVLLSASRAFLDGPGGRVWVANLSARNTAFPLAGYVFGAEERSWTLEGSLAVFLRRDLAVGGEYRQLGRQDGDRARAWRDVFVAWFPSKRWQLALAYVELGDNNGGAYLQLQYNF